MLRSLVQKTTNGRDGRPKQNGLPPAATRPIDESAVGVGVGRSSDPPFTPTILAVLYPARFKMPTVAHNDGSTDADEHLENYQAHMLIQNANKATLCKPSA